MDHEPASEVRWKWSSPILQPVAVSESSPLAATTRMPNSPEGPSTTTWYLVFAARVTPVAVKVLSPFVNVAGLVSVCSRLSGALVPEAFE